MNISEIFIRRPVMTTLVMLSILLFGVIGYTLLPVSDLPNVDRATISVSASLPGASPETMATTVATPLEKEFSTIAGIDSMSSSSSQGSTRITLQFTLERNIDAAAQDVQTAIARCVRRLPDEMTDPPSYRKVNPADQPILFLVLTSPTLSMSDLDALAETVLAQRISMVPGVAQVEVHGAQKYAVRVRLDPRKLASRDIGIDEVATVIGQYNVNMPLGNLVGPERVASIQASGKLLDAKAFSPLIVTYRNGQPVRLRDIGEVLDSVENDRMGASYNTRDFSRRAIMLMISKQPGTNTVQVADAVKALLPSFKEKLPSSVTVNTLRDSSESIKASVRDVQFTLILTLCLVVLVIFLFLRNLSATIIPSLTLPMSIVGTFAAMYLLKYSLDNLSLMALTLSVGFVVDDAIVMLENIVRHMEMGKTRLQAALDGARQVGFTIISMTLSLAAVFIPVLLMGGLVGRLFREFAVTIGVAVLVSGVVALTLTPMLSSRFLRDPGKVRHHWAYKVSEMGFQAMIRFYDGTLRFVLRHKPATMAFSALVLAATAYLFTAVPSDFLPSEDRDVIMVQTEGAQDIAYPVMKAHQDALEKIAREDPDIERFMSSSGGGFGGGGSNTGMMILMLKPRSERSRSVDQIINELRPKLASVPGVRAFLSNPPPINVGGRMSRSLYQATLQGADIDELYRHAGEFEQTLRGLPEFTDVSSDMQLNNPQLNITIDKDQAFVLGLTPSQIDGAIYNAYGTRQVSTIYTPADDYAVIMELDPKFHKDPSLMSLLHVRSSGGQLVPLSAVTTRSEDVGPLSINHTGQTPSVTVSFNLRPGVALGDAVDKVRKITQGAMPATMMLTFQGTVQEFEKAQKSLVLLLPLAIIVIYIVLGILYESFYHPITILSALPFAGFGALVTLLAFNTPLSIYAFVGIIMLVGLVKKNGIMMVDFAIEAQRTEGKNPEDAIHEACMVRFRPIMMTTMAALMAGLPIAFGIGAGSESRRPLGLAVVGGLLFSQALTLYVTPVFYVYMEKFRVWVHELLHGETLVPTAEIEPVATVEP